MLLHRILLLGLLLVILISIILPYKKIDLFIDQETNNENTDDKLNICMEDLYQAQDDNNIITTNCNNDKNIIQKKFDDCKNNISQIKLDYNSRLSECYDDKQSLQSKIEGKISDSSSSKIDLSDCNKNKNDLQIIYDKLNIDYNKLIDKIILLQNKSDNSTLQVTIAQEMLINSQKQVTDVNNMFINLENKYNNLVQQYKDLQDSYKNIADKYYVKCYDYHLNYLKNNQ
jgi:chromosome segregation ATPase